MTYWLSYGGGRNSTALAIMIVEGILPEFEPCRFVFADTWTERDATYQYISDVFIPYLARHGRTLEIVQPIDGVYMRWKRYSVTGSRQIRTCTQESKRRPIENYIKLHGGGEQLIGIDAGEPHRAISLPGKHYPLVTHGIDLDGCISIIKRAGISVPPKSGCWCCPFMRIGEVMDLARNDPEKFAKIEALEAAANAKHGYDRTAIDEDTGETIIVPAKVRMQWGNKPAKYWRERAMRDATQGVMDFDIEMPCECFDGV